MATLLVLNGYTPPSPTKYDVDFESINGAEEQLENGYTYVEQTRAQVPKISVGWANLVESDAEAILNAVRPALITCQYYFGGQRTDIFRCKNPKLTLKLENGAERYYDVSLTLEG